MCAIQLLERCRIAMPAALRQLEVDRSHISCRVRRARGRDGLPGYRPGHRRHIWPRRRLPAASGSPALPPDRRKIAHPGHTHLNGFGAQKLAFQLQIASVTAQRATRSDDPVTGSGRVATFAHDRADGPPGPWRPGEGRDIAVGRHPASRDSFRTAARTRVLKATVVHASLLASPFVFDFRSCSWIRGSKFGVRRTPPEPNPNPNPNPNLNLNTNREVENREA